MEITFFIVMVLFLCFFYQDPREFKRVIPLRVVDGDTLWVREEREGGGSYPVRLASIDAPEFKQLSFDGRPIGLWAKRALRQAVQGQHLILEEIGRDRYGRHLGEIHLLSPASLTDWPLARGEAREELHGTGVSLKLLRQGLALVYPFARFSSAREKNLTLRVFHQSIRERKGIWGTRGFLNPYEYRKRHKRRQAQAQMKRPGPTSTTSTLPPSL